MTLSEKQTGVLGILGGIGAAALLFVGFWLAGFWLAGGGS